MSTSSKSVIKEKNTINVLKIFSEEDKSILNLGGVITLVVCVLYLVITVLIAVDPVGMYIGSEEGYAQLMKTPNINSIWRALFAVLCFLCISFVNALILYVGKGNSKYAGILKWFHIAMVASMIIGVLNWVYFIHANSDAVSLYNHGYTIRELNEIITYPIDSYFIWTWGIYGLGYIIINVIALKTNRLSKKMSFLGILCGIQCVLMVTIYITQFSLVIGGVVLNTTIIIAGTLGGITAPLYHFNIRKYLTGNVKIT